MKTPTLDDILAAREVRAERLRSLLLEWPGCAVVSLTLNIPGERKAHGLAREAFRIARGALLAVLRARGVPVRKAIETASATGFEGAYAVAGAVAGGEGRETEALAAEVKRLAMSLEDTHPLGRLFDIDVLAPGGTPVRGVDLGRAERTCIVCGGPVWACARSRAHPAEELALRVDGLIRDYLRGEFAERMAEAAVRSLLHEVLVTPKPGLVDRANNGSHTDMDAFTFAASAAALAGYFREAARTGAAAEEDAVGEEKKNVLPALLGRLRPPGILAEERMLAVTGGVNTHRGAIFTLGLLCAAAGVVWGRGEGLVAERVLAVCRAIAGGVEEDFASDGGATHGRAAFRLYGLKGVRGEAASGYPAVLAHGLPAWRAARTSGASVNDAGVAALLALIAVVEDTNVVARAGAEELAAIQTNVAAFLAGRPSATEVLGYAAELDRLFIAKNISPGGAADLLAAVLFLDGIEGIGGFCGAE